MQKKLILFGIAAMLAVAVACGGDKKNPVSPSSSGGAGTDAAADGSTLKVSAPAPISPVSNVEVDTRRPSLVARHATGTFVTVSQLTYQFQVVNAADVEVYNADNVPSGSADRSTHTLTADLAYGTPYRWRARARQESNVGPWSAYATFRTVVEAPAPTHQSPPDGSTVDSNKPTLTIVNSKVAPGLGAVRYRFVVETTAGAGIVSTTVAAGTTTTAYTFAADVLQWEGAYRWRARVEAGSVLGIWSAYTTFRTPVKPKDPYETPGYRTATELWDPLVNGVSIGRAINMEFIPGQGARTVDNTSRITYNLLQTLSEGEFSFYAYNVNPLSAGDKTKLMSMQEGEDDITTNDYRFTFEKRGASYPTPGQVRVRIIAGDSSPDAGRIFDGGPIQPTLEKNVWYFVRSTWGSGAIRVFIADGGPDGRVRVDLTTRYGSFTYKPNPHVAHVGAPCGRGGCQDASVSNMTVKGVFIGGPGAKRPAMFDGIGGIDPR
jgi:hypothetical protein